jgi:hypothetical protein
VPTRFERVGGGFLGMPLCGVDQVEIDGAIFHPLDDSLRRC